MFERLLEKLLLSKLGKFITSIDQKNLRVALWQGNITLKNALLRSDALEALGLPLKIKYGKIDSLEVKVPWTRLGSSPVEVSIVGLLVVLAPEARDDLEIYAKLELLDALDDQEDHAQPGYLQKVGGKVLDNLKVDIRDINLIFEHKDFSAGFSLHKIDLITTNEHWEWEFTDKKDVIYKLLDIQALACYLIPYKRDSLSNGYENLNGFLAENVDSVIFNINLQARITHVNHADHPMLNFEVLLSEITFKYSHLQFLQTYKVLEYFAEYNRQCLHAESLKKIKIFSPVHRNPRDLWKFAIESAIKINKQKSNPEIDYFIVPKIVKKELKESFIANYAKLNKGNELSYTEKQNLHRSVYYTDKKTLIKWVKKLKVEQERSYFSFFRRSKKVKEPEKRSIQLSSDPYLSATVSLPKSLVQFQGESSEIIIEFSEISLSLKKRIVGGDAILKVNDFQVLYGQEIICQKIHSDQNLPLSRIDLRHKPFESDCEAHLSISSLPLEINYSKQFLKDMIKFFALPSAKESVKNAAWDTITDLQVNTQSSLNELLSGNKRFLLKLDISGPRINFPVESGTFSVNLGKIRVWNTMQFIAGEYENYNVEGTNMNILYRDSEYLIEDFGVKVTVSVLRKIYSQKKWNQFLNKLEKYPDFTFKIQIPNIVMHFYPQLYYDVLEVIKTLEFDHETMEYINLDRINIEKNSACSGYIKKQSYNMQSWFEYFAVISGSYIYFFETKFNAYASGYYYIKDCDIYDIMPDTFKLSNRTGECVLYIDEDIHKWKQALKNRIAEIKTYYTQNARDTPIKYAGHHTFRVESVISSIEFMIKNDFGEKIGLVKFKDIQGSLDMRPFDFTASGNINNFSVLYIPKASYLLRSKNALTLTVHKLNEKSPNYKDTDIQVFFKLGTLEIDWVHTQIRDIYSILAVDNHSENEPKRKIGKIQSQHILLDIELVIKNIELNLFIEEYSLKLASFIMSKATTKIIVKNGTHQCDFNSKIFEVYDMSDYPRTSTTHTVQPFRLFSTGEGSEFNIHILIYAQDYPQKPKDIGSIIGANIKDVSIVYLHQPMIRIKDFLQSKVMNVFDVSVKNKQSFIWKSMSHLSILLIPEIPEVDTDRNYASMDIRFENISIMLPPRPSFQECFCLKADKILLKNFPGVSVDRNKSVQINSVNYDIQMINCQMTVKEYLVCESFNMQLFIEFPDPSPSQKSHEFDKSRKISGSFSPLLFNLDQSYYMLFMHLIYLNLSYDDKLDAFLNIIPVFDYSKIENPELIMDLNLSFDKFSVLLKHEEENITELLFTDMNLALKQYENYSMDAILKSSNFLGLIDKDISFKYNVESRLTNSFFWSREKDVFKMDFHMGSEGNKDIIIELEKLKFNFNLPVFLQIQNYFYYGVPDYRYSLETPYDFLHYNEFIEKSSVYAPRISVNVSIRSPMFLFPIQISNRVIILQSDVHFTYFKEKEAVYRLGAVPACVKRLMAHELEVYSCPLSELNNNPTKRKIMQKSMFSYECIERKRDVFDSVFEVFYKTDKLTFKLTHQDFLLLNRAIGIQSTMLSEESALTESLSKVNSTKNGPAFLCPESPAQYPIQKTLSCSTKYLLEDLSLLFINDTKDAYSPLFWIVFRDINMIGVENADLWTLSISMIAKLDYYNPIINIWDPVIEPFCLILDVLMHPENNPKNEIMLKIPIFNLNLSESMIKYLNTILETWRKFHQDEGIENIQEKVSPLDIHNATGHIIVVKKNARQENIFNIQPGEIANYQIDTNLVVDPDLSREVLSVSVIINGNVSKPVTSIPFYKVHSSTHSIEINGESYPLIIDIKLHGTRKLLTFRSPVMIKNLLGIPLNMILKSGTRLETRLCESNEEIPLPIFYYDGLFGFSLEDLDSKIVTLFNFSSHFLNHKRPYKEVKISRDCFLIIEFDDKEKNKQVLYLKSPVTYKNRLPRNIILSFINDRGIAIREFGLKSGEDEKDMFNSRISRIGMSVQVNGFPGASKSINFSDRLEPPKTIKVFDIDNNPLILEIGYIKGISLEIIIYPAIAIINNTSNNLIFYHKSRGYNRPLPGQHVVNKIIPCANTKKLAVSLDSNRSNFFKISTVGFQNIVQLAEADPCYQFIYDVQLTQVVREELFFTRVVTISPRYIFQNDLDTDLFIKQFNTSASPLIFPSQSASAFHWQMRSTTEPMAIARIGTDWSWSGAFNISSIGNFSIQLKNVYENSYQLIKVDIKIINNSAYVIFSFDEHVSYLVKNSSNVFSLKVYQTHFADDWRWVPPMSSSPFAWFETHSEHIINLKFFIDDIPVQNSEEYLFNFEKMNQKYKIIIEEQQVFICSYIKGFIKTIEISDSKVKKEEYKNEVIFDKYIFSILKFGVSIIEYTNEHPAELLYFSLSKINLEVQKIQKFWQGEVSIKSIQIDNQSSRTPIFPVLLFSEKKIDRPAFQLSFSLYSEADFSCYEFKYLELLFQTLWLRLESHIVRRLLGLIGRIFLNERPVYSTMELFHKFSEVAPSKIDVKSIRLYFGSLKLCPVKIVCSYLPTKGEEEATSKSFATVTDALGMAIIAIDSAPMKLNALEMKNFGGSQSQIASALTLNYKTQLIKEVLSLIGHSVILGNPFGFFKNLGTGVFDFFYEPAQGIIKGPISAGKGFVKGTTSLVSHTIEGTFGTFSKITSSLATGISVLGHDKDYNIERQYDQAINKPQDLVDGLGKGLKSFFASIGRGVSGIVTEPIKGYKKKKMKGLLSGSAIGFSGVILKPMTGVLDVASLTAEGIKNTAIRGEEVFVPRKRMPRPFYGPYQILKCYNEYDAEALFFLTKLRKGRFVHEKFVGQCVAKDLRGQVWILGLFLNVLVLADIRMSKIIWIVKSRDILYYEVVKHGIALFTKVKKYRGIKTDGVFLVPFRDSDVVQYATKILDYLFNILH